MALLVRTSRRFSVTEAEAGESLGDPTGHLRVACPMALAYAIVGRLAIGFMERHPRVSVTLESTDGRGRPFGRDFDLDHRGHAGHEAVRTGCRA